MMMRKDKDIYLLIFFLDLNKKIQQRCSAAAAAGRRPTSVQRSSREYSIMSHMTSPPYLLDMPLLLYGPTALPAP